MGRVEKQYKHQLSSRFDDPPGLDKAHYFKGVDNLIKAVSKLDINNWKLYIVGQGELRSEYIKLAEKCGVGDKVIIDSDADNDKLVKHYQSSDLFVLPSINKCEAFGVVLLEAMASGVPVIASRLPGVRSVFEDGVHGLYVEPGSIEDLTSKIDKMLSGSEKLKTMGEAGRKLAEEKYNQNKLIHKIRAVIDMVLS